MPLLMKIVRRLGRNTGAVTWVAIMAAFVIFLGLTWASLAIFEPTTNAAIYQARNAWWYFIVTATSTGYGDFAAQSHGGRAATALFAQLGGLGLMGAVLGKIAETVITSAKKRNRGMSDYSKATGHTIFVGWRKEATPQVMRVIAHENPDAQMVLVAKTPEENPTGGLADYVRAESGADPKALGRAGAANMARALVYCSTDEESLSALIALRQLSGPKAPIVVWANEDEFVGLMRTVCPHAEIVRPMRINILARALLDPGSSVVAEDIYCNTDGGSAQYSCTVSDNPYRSYLWGTIADILQGKNALAIAIDFGPGWTRGKRILVNPARDVRVFSGSTIFYVAEQRVQDPLAALASVEEVA